MGETTVAGSSNMLHNCKSFKMGSHMLSILCPDIMFTHESFLLKMWIPSIIFLLKPFNSLASILVLWNENWWPVVATWQGMPLSLVKSGWISSKSPSHESQLRLQFHPSFPSRHSSNHSSFPPRYNQVTQFQQQSIMLDVLLKLFSCGVQSLGVHWRYFDCLRWLLHRRLCTFRPKNLFSFSFIN